MTIRILELGFVRDVVSTTEHSHGRVVVVIVVRSQVADRKFLSVYDKIKWIEKEKDN